MATMTVTQALPTGEALTYNSIVAGGDILPNDGKTVVLFRNASSSTTITVTSQKQISGLDIEDPVYALGVGDVAIGPFDPTIFNTAAGAVEFSYSGGGIATTTYRAVSI